uniref:Uncharacterized protein n=1 Tax=Rhizophora mucronata TaxID=61149 RepID=A0A2P2QL29_RHIMU
MPDSWFSDRAVSLISFRALTLRLCK